jgi:glucans biosynthesis protein
MKTCLNRREIIALTMLAAMPFPKGAFAQSSSQESIPFSFDRLTERMAELAKREYEEPENILSEAVTNLTYDEHRSIRFLPDRARFKASSSRFELQAFHPGWLFKKPVTLFRVAGGQAMPMGFTESDFVTSMPEVAAKLKDDALPGVAGFRLHYPLNNENYKDELISFLGASYFRALGRQNVYGLSARGLALNTATDKPEEFPRFTEFYVEEPAPNASEIKIWAALEGPSVTGAFAFRINPGENTLIDVTARIILRREVSRLGLAPMTSMFLFAENNRADFDDYRPQVHDSDGLAIERSDGERVWRPLNNNEKIAFSYISGASPNGFGLLQRDRTFNQYQDSEARYEKRPSLWIEPGKNWGEGGVHLIEIPTKLEINDNIVAFWEPAKHPNIGEIYEYNYRMRWGMYVYGNPEPAIVVSTRTGHGGTSGGEPDPELRKFVIDLEGSSLTGSIDRAKITHKIAASGGNVVWSGVILLPDGKGVRLVADVRRTSDEPVELRGYLMAEERILSETWIYQWV